MSDQSRLEDELHDYLIRRGPRYRFASITVCELTPTELGRVVAIKGNPNRVPANNQSRPLDNPQHANCGKYRRIPPRNE